MIEKLEHLAAEISSLHSKLILLVGPPHSGKTSLLIDYGKRVGVEPLSLGAKLGRRLAALPQTRRPFEAATILRELADQHTKDDLLLIDNIELLFDRMLMLDPLDLLKRQSHARRVIAVWPGELHDGRLTYAEMGHPEYQDYGLDGLVPFKIQ